MGTIRENGHFGIRRCVCCGKEYTPRSGNSCYCSKECQKASIKQKREEWKELMNSLKSLKNAGKRICMFCGREYTPRQKWQLYCSFECERKSNAKKPAAEKEAVIISRSRGNYPTWAEVREVLGREKICSYYKAIEILKKERESVG